MSGSFCQRGPEKRGDEIRNEHTKKKQVEERGKKKKKTPTRSSSNTPRWILSKISLDASSNARSTLCPDFALASTNKRPSCRAHRVASSIVTWRCLGGVEGTNGEEGPSGGSQRSTLLPTRIQVRCGSACSRTSASQARAFIKPVFKRGEIKGVGDVMTFRNRTSAHRNPRNR